jgi:hypothetical protein
MITSLLLSLVTSAWASATGTDEMLSNIEMVPPVVVFVVDLSSDMDSPCDGEATSMDTPYMEQSGYVSGVSITAYGTVLYGTANPDTDESVVETLRVVTDPFMGTATVAWVEMY